MAERSYRKAQYPNKTIIAILAAVSTSNSFWDYATDFWLPRSRHNRLTLLWRNRSAWKNIF